jgi:hypothetical protein
MAIELTGGVSMKALSIIVILITLVAAPVSAGMMTSEDGDQRAPCGLSAARMIVNWSGDSVIFPVDVTICRELDGEAGSESRTDSLPLEPANGSAGSELSLEIATLGPVSSR